MKRQKFWSFQHSALVGSMSQQPSKYYIGQMEKLVETFTTHTIEECCSYLLPYLTSGMNILDVGCGPGSITIGFAKRSPRGRAMGIDIEAASPALQRGYAQAEREGVANVEFQTGGGHALAFPDNTFDVTHSHQVLHSTDDPVQFMREMYRVTKPGGFVACRVWDSGSWILHPYNDGMRSFFAILFRIDAERGLPPHTGRYLHVWARQAGFDPERIKVSTLTSAFRAPEERAYCAGVFRAMCRESEFAAVSLKKGYFTKEDLARMVEGWQTWMDDEDGFGAMINVQLLYQK